MYNDIELCTSLAHSMWILIRASDFVVQRRVVRKRLDCFTLRSWRSSFMKLQDLPSINVMLFVPFVSRET